MMTPVAAVTMCGSIFGSQGSAQGQRQQPLLRRPDLVTLSDYVSGGDMEKHMPIGPRCFVIMPFSVRQDDLQRYLNDANHWHQVYEGLIVPGVSKAGLNCERDDEETSSRLIVENIWRKIETADLVLCDLSSWNPNVLLELGWALRADKRFVLVKDDLTPFAFDLNQFFTFTYSHQLQPKTLRTQIGELATVVAGTMKDALKRYSIASKLAISRSATEESAKGNVEVRLLEQVLSEVRSLKSQGETPGADHPDRGPFVCPTEVQIYWHDTGLDLSAAWSLRAYLESEGISCKINPHRDSASPDSVFIGALVGAREARIVLERVPYDIRFLFRPDYPEGEGGSESGLRIGIGYMSTHYKDGRGKRSIPVAVNKDDLARLTKPGLSNTAFQMVLRELALQKEQNAARE